METKHLIIIGLVAIILVFLISIVAFTFMNPTVAYENFTCNDTGTTFEVPVGTKVRQDLSVEGIRSSTMSTPSGDIVIERQVGDNPYIDDTLEGASDLINSYNGDNVNGVELHTYSKTAKNEATGEVILVTSNTGDNETVDHIINSIKWGNKTVVSNTTGSNSVSYSTHSTSNNTHKYSEEDLDNARTKGYFDGYFDGIDDMSNYDGDYYYEGDGSSEASSSSESGSVETTVDTAN